MLLLATVMLTGKFRLCINYFDIPLSLDLKEGDGSGKDKKSKSELILAGDVGGTILASGFSR